MQDILDVFYKELIHETSDGRVDCYFFYNTYFYTNLVQDKNIISGTKEYDNVVVPTLIIKDKVRFDALLVSYVNLAKEFYVEDKHITRIKEIDETLTNKMILTHLWSNAIVEDFNDPILFLEKRISFMKNDFEQSKFSFGYSELLDGDINLEIAKDTLVNETPYRLNFSLCTKENKVYHFPQVKFGIYEDKVYIYAIQNQDMDLEIKKVNRSLYKIGEGFNSEEDNYNLFGEGNLKDVTASFLVSLNMAVAFFKQHGFEKIIVPSILPVRWNAKSIYSENKVQKDPNFITDKQDEIQRNLTDKFLRTFLRLAYHYEGIDVLSYPYEVDSNLTLYVNDELNCNNKLLSETFELINNQKKSHKL